MRFGQKTTKQTIEQVASNDQSLESLDLTKNASFCMKSLDNTVALADALKCNTVLKTVVLRECEIVDDGAAALGEALAVNSTIEELDLQQNKLTTKGVIALAAGLAKNKGVRTLNLMNQAQKALGEQVLEEFIAMFESNLTLTKLMWKVDSRRTWELSKLITRNVEIARRLAAKGEIQDLLPAKLRSGPSLIAAMPTPSSPSRQKQEAAPTLFSAEKAAPQKKVEVPVATPATSLEVAEEQTKPEEVDVPAATPTTSPEVAEEKSKPEEVDNPVATPVAEEQSKPEEVDVDTSATSPEVAEEQSKPEEVAEEKSTPEEELAEAVPLTAEEVLEEQPKLEVAAAAAAAVFQEVGVLLPASESPVAESK